MENLRNLSRDSLRSAASKFSQISQISQLNFFSAGFPTIDVKIGNFRGRPAFAWKFLGAEIGRRKNLTESDFRFLREVFKIF